MSWLPQNVRDELWVAKSLVFCCSQDLGRPCFDRVFCGDSTLRPNESVFLAPHSALWR